MPNIDGELFSLFASAMMGSFALGFCVGFLLGWWKKIQRDLIQSMD
jgi:hypothetical protein